MKYISKRDRNAQRTRGKPRVIFATTDPFKQIRTDAQARAEAVRRVGGESRPPAADVNERQRAALREARDWLDSLGNGPVLESPVSDGP